MALIYIIAGVGGNLVNIFYHSSLLFFLSVCLYVSIHLSLLSVCLSVCPSLSVPLSLCMSVGLSVHHSLSLCLCLSLSISVCLSLSLPVFLVFSSPSQMSAIFIPYQINGGASPAVFGLLSVLFVELFQSWQIVDRAWLEVLKLTGILVFLLAVGTLPFIDNLANIGGFLFGIPAAIIFLPYITFGKWDAWRKRILLIICIPLLIIMYAVAFIVFYLVRDPDFCSVCHYFNCIPYTSGLCDNEIDNPTPDIFAL